MSAQPSTVAMWLSEDHEMSAWLRATATRRVHALTAQLAKTNAPTDVAVIAPLGRPTSPGNPEDRTCDRCRRHSAPPATFYVATLARSRFTLIVGLCADCAELEGWTPGRQVAV